MLGLHQTVLGRAASELLLEVGLVVSHGISGFCVLTLRKASQTPLPLLLVQ